MGPKLLGAFGACWLFTESLRIASIFCMFWNPARFDISLLEGDEPYSEGDALAYDSLTILKLVSAVVLVKGKYSSFVES